MLIYIVITSLLECYWIAWIANHLLSPIVPYWYRLVLADPSQMNQAGPAQDPRRRQLLEAIGLSKLRTPRL